MFGFLILTFFFTSPPSPIETAYIGRQVTDATPFIQRDGNTLLSIDGKLRNIFGWNPDFPDTTTNEDWESANNGLGWTLRDDEVKPPRRHLNGYSVINDEAIIWGGDSFISGYPQADAWTWNIEDGWAQVTSDWSGTGGSRMMFAWTAHKGYLLMAGGQTNIDGTQYNDILKSTDKGATWQNVGTLPINSFSCGVLLSFNNDLYIVGGGQYSIASYNNKVYKSTNDGVSWSEISTVPDGMIGIFQNGCVWDEKMWMLGGFNQSTVGNVQGLWYSLDGITWTSITSDLAASPAPTPRHASGICVHNDELYICCGNNAKDVYKVTAYNYHPTDSFNYSDYGTILSWLKYNIDYVEQDGKLRVWYDSNTNTCNECEQATISSQPIFNNGEITFDGSDDFLTYAKRLGKPENFTLFMYAKVADISNRVALCSASNSIGGNGSIYMSMLNKQEGSSGTITSYIGDGSNLTGTVSNTALLENNIYTLIGIRYQEGDDFISIYKNGIEVTTEKVHTSADSNSGSPQNFSIGRLGDYASPGFQAPMSVKEMLVYSTVVSDEDIFTISDEIIKRIEI